uniref:carbonic anhydrase n=1 Tax=Crocodylus porosus TaxID=8502 RepID=A0A7M4DXK9_CROPO
MLMFSIAVLRGGPVQGAYRLRQLHFHWGSSDDHGSEHIIDGLPFGPQLHMVHWNPKHGNFAGALKQRDGVAVVGIFLQDWDLHWLLKRLLSSLFKGKEAPFHHFDPSILFPKSRDYWTYEGSFTTPPCEECITWILLREPVVVSPDQMAKLRSLSMNAENEPFCPLVDNWRPPQPLKGRVVRASFK